MPKACSLVNVSFADQAVPGGNLGLDKATKNRKLCPHPGASGGILMPALQAISASMSEGLLLVMVQCYSFVCFPF